MRQTLLFLSFSILVLTSCQKTETIDSYISARPGGANGGGNNGGGSTVNLTQGLVAFYPFNGNANDASGNGNNGTVNGATLTTDRFNRRNRAYNFNGISDYILGNTNNFPIGSQARSVSAWFKVVKYPNPNLTYVLFNYGTAIGGQSCGLAIDSIAVTGSRLNFFSWNENNSDVIAPNYFELNVWHNLIGTYDGTVGKLYFNGNLISSNTTSWNTVISAFMIGKNNESNGTLPYYFKGKLDDIRIYNRALNQAEITYLARN